MPDWTYTINGGDSRSANADPASPWALSLVSRAQFNQQAGSVLMERVISADYEPVMSEWDDVKIYRDGVLWFAGKAQDPVEHPSPQGITISYTVVDHWRTMEETYFRIENNAPFPAIPILNSTIPIFWNWVRTQWNDQLDGYCVTPAFPASMAAYPISRKPFDNTHFADQARSMLKWYLHAGVCWDYSAGDGIPLMKLRATGDRVVTLARGVPPLADMAVTPAGHLSPISVETRFSNNPSPFEFSTEIFGSADNQGIYPHTATRGAPGSLTLFVPSGAYINGQSEFIYQTLTQPIYRGPLLLRARHCNSGIQPGDTINITNSRAAHATMQAMVQTVVETLGPGETLITVGATGDDDAQTIGQKYNEWTAAGQWRPFKFVPFA